MRGFLQKEFRNIVFIVLVVAAALAIYLLSRTVKSAEETAAPEPTHTEAAPKGTSPATSETVFSGVPEEVLLAHLLTAEAFSAEPAKDGDRTWILAVGESPKTTARFSYTVERGEVTGFSLTLALPVEASSKSKSGIDQALAAAEGERKSAWSRAVVALLTDLVPACDANDAIADSTVRDWAQKASAFGSESSSYADEAGGALFDAYIAYMDDGPALVCTLAAQA